MTLTSFFLVTAEFLPAGMLTLIAQGLDVTEGQAGQMVAVTAFAGLLVAPTIAMVFPRLNRRSLLILMSLLAAVSNALVALAPSLLIVLIARLLLGAAISGFWAMAIVVAERIAGPKRLGRAMMFNSAGVSLATVAGVPLGVLLGEAIGWRGVFVAMAVVSVALAVLLWLALPSVPAKSAIGPRSMIRVTRRRGIGVGMLANVSVVAGHFIAYSYIRVSLERVKEAGVVVEADTIVFLLTLFGLGGLIGNVVFGAIVDRWFRMMTMLTPAVIAGLVLLITAMSGSAWATGGAVFVWGFFFASWLLIANTWVAHRLPDQLEAGGGLVTTGFQAGIMVAAVAGGLLVDAFSINTVYVLGAVLLVLGALQFGISNCLSRPR